MSEALQDPARHPDRPPPGVVLCPAADLAPDAIRRFQFGRGRDPFRAFVVMTEAGVRGYADWCPHQHLQLQDDRDEIMRQEGLIVCQWHLARFSPLDGKAVDGPCLGQGLPPWPVTVGADGLVRTG